MSSAEARRHDMPPEPPTDEGYWAALLAAAEMAMEEEVPPVPSTSTDIEDYTLHTNGVAAPDTTGVGASADWQQAQQVFETDTTVELRVVGFNRGGLLVEWGTLQGFVPASQLVEFPIEDYSLPSRRDALMGYVGRLLRLRIIELSRINGRLILSERAATVPPGTRDDLLTTLSPGDTCEGYVTNLVQFGVFVDLGGVEGLIHISELSWGRVRHPSDVVQAGQHVRVYVLDVDADDGRVALSLKRLQPDPWQTVEENYAVGQLIEGTVTHVVDFGAFVCIEKGLEGLVHVSELAEGHFLHPYNVVKEGDKVQARILHIDGNARRLGLSLRQQ
jgi:small subunit ribosomal protein S1